MCADQHVQPLKVLLPDLCDANGHAQPISGKQL